MTRGCLLFAHDGKIDYGSQAVLAARLAHKHLSVPVSLVSDQDTISNIKQNFDSLPFDQIIEVQKPQTNNTRVLNGAPVEFINANRSSAFDLTPYDRTLVIDSDFLIFSNELGKYWHDEHEFLITPGMLELANNIEPLEHSLGADTIKLLWATNIMFSKTPRTKMLFDLVDYIKEEYRYYSHLYEFNTKQYRNDYAFSIACHIMSGHGLDPWHGELPIPMFYRDSSEIVSVQPDNHLVFLVRNMNKYLVSKCQNQDVHVMNKQSLLRNLDKLLELAND